MTRSASSKDDLKEARGEIEREIGSFIKSIKLGVDYTDHDKTLGRSKASWLRRSAQMQAAIPSSILQQSFTLDRGFGPILSWDPRAVRDQGILRYHRQHAAEQRLPCRRKGLDAVHHGAARCPARRRDPDRQYRPSGRAHGPGVDQPRLPAGPRPLLDVAAEPEPQFPLAEWLGRSRRRIEGIYAAAPDRPQQRDQFLLRCYESASTVAAAATRSCGRTRPRRST